MKLSTKYEIGANQSSADQDGTDNITGLPIMTSDDTVEVISKSPNSHSNIADDDTNQFTRLRKKAITISVEY